MLDSSILLSVAVACEDYEDKRNFHPRPQVAERRELTSMSMRQFVLLLTVRSHSSFPPLPPPLSLPQPPPPSLPQQPPTQPLQELELLDCTLTGSDVLKVLRLVDGRVVRGCWKCGRGMCGTCGCKTKVLKQYVNLDLEVSD